jgi:hypothetical protein
MTAQVCFAVGRLSAARQRLHLACDYGALPMKSYLMTFLMGLIIVLGDVLAKISVPRLREL